MQQSRSVRAEDRGGRRTVPAATLAGFILLCAGCVGDVERTLYPAVLGFDCADGKVMQVRRSADGRTATVVIDGKSVVLARAASAAEEKYSDGAYMLYLDRERAFLENNGKVIFGPCQSQAALPTAPRRDY